jgi:hypothetical protein
MITLPEALSALSAEPEASYCANAGLAQKAEAVPAKSRPRRNLLDALETFMGALLKHMHYTARFLDARAFMPLDCHITVSPTMDAGIACTFQELIVAAMHNKPCRKGSQIVPDYLIFADPSPALRATASASNSAPARQSRD